MIKKIMLSFFVFIALTSVASAQTESQQVEIYHLEKDEVIKRLPSTPIIQQEASTFINNIDSLYKKFDPIPAKGFMVKVPLTPPFSVDNQWMDHDVDQVIVIFPEKEDPFLLLFNEENSARFFTFKGNTKKFLNEIDVQRTN